MAGGIISMFPSGSEGTVVVEAPDLTGVQNIFEYTGKPIGPESLVTYDERHIKVSNGTATNVGNYTMTFTLRNKKTMLWKDTMTTDDKTFSYSIGEVAVAVPTCSPASATYTYDGSAHFPTITRDEARTTMKVTNSSGTVVDATNIKNVGTYTITVSLNSKTLMKWKDNNGTEDRIFAFTINKAAGTLTLRDSSNNDVTSTGITLDKTKMSADVTASGYVGTLSASSSDTSVATVSVSGSKITVTSPSSKTGTITITVQTAGDSNHNGVTKQFSVKGNFLFIGSFSDTVSGGHLNEVAKALQAGSITVDDLPWSVADTANITHASGTYQWLIYDIDRNGSTGYTFSDGSRVHYIIGTRNCLKTTMSFGALAWRDSKIRTYLNDSFLSDLPTDVRNAFSKQFVSKTGNMGSTTVTNTNDFFAIPSEKEVFNMQTNASREEAAELKQFKAYENASYRIKKTGDNGSACWWWNRGPCAYATSTSRICEVNTNGQYGYGGYDGNSSDGTSPFGCI